MGDGASSSGTRSGVKGETLVLDHGRRKSTCGYCKTPNFTSIAHGLWVYSITVDDYQDLLDRGWRRSGSYIYKPEMERTCCPSYTIRLKAADFVPSKEQERVLKRVQRHLNCTLDLKRSDQLKNKACSPKVVHSVANCASMETLSESLIQDEATKEDGFVNYLSKKIDDAVNACILSGDFSSNVELPKAIAKKLNPQAKKKLMHISEEPLYTSSISFQVVAALRRHHIAQGNGSDQNGDSLALSPSSVAEKLAHIMNLREDPRGVTVSACNGHLNFFSARTHANSEMVTSSTAALAQSSENQRGNRCSQLAVENTAQMHKIRQLEIHMKRSSFDPEEYDLYKRYQIAVHKDKPEEVTEAQYNRFLVDTPLIFVPYDRKSRTVPPCGFGSFHQQYRINGKLVAVGVVDILPRCLSSKYLFWDPELASLSLGKYSALKEIDWVNQTVVNCPSLQYYYLGYYIHSCNKMRYKAAYRPSELLCPLRYEWVPFTIAKPLLDKKSYVVLSDYASLQNGALSHFDTHETSNQPEFNDVHHGGHTESPTEEEGEMEIDFESEESETDEESNVETSDLLLNDGRMTADVNNIMLNLNGSRVKFKDLQPIFGPISKKYLDSLERQLRRYASAVGAVLADRMVYSLI